MMHKKITTVTHLGLIAVMLTLFMVPFAQETRATTYVTSVSDVMSSLKKSTASRSSNSSGKAVSPLGNHRSCSKGYDGRSRSAAWGWRAIRRAGAGSGSAPRTSPIQPTILTSVSSWNQA